MDCAAKMFLQWPVHLTKTSIQVACFQQIGENQGETRIFPVSFIQDTMACSYKICPMRTAYCTKRLSVMLHQDAKIVQWLKWLLLATYCLCMLSSSAKVKSKSPILGTTRWQCWAPGGVRCVHRSVCVDAGWRGVGSLTLVPAVPPSTSQSCTLEPSNPGDSPRSGEGGLRAALPPGAGGSGNSCCTGEDV